jgi:hypothetical protein
MTTGNAFNPARGADIGLKPGTKGKVMKKVASVLVALGCLVVAGCQSTKSPYDPDKPIDKMTPEELCHY